MAGWHCVLELDERRQVVGGDVEALADAVKRGADIRSYTTFDYAEHMGVPESREGLVQEMMSFSTVYWLEGGHVAGIQTTRYPANASLGFGNMPSLSFFLYNSSGQSAIARLFVDGSKGQTKQPGDHKGKYRVIDAWDELSPCPSENFIYDFGEYEWWVNDSWEELLAHDENGAVLHGSLEDLQEAFRSGLSLKVGVKNLCADLSSERESSISHDVFVELHSVYSHRDSGFLGGESQPVVRVAPHVPLRYASGNWNCGWILPRTDGIVHHLIVNPHTHEFLHKESRCAMRWFAR